ncbi:hypothetical protein [Streptomyces sp. Ag109_G2-15]|uniref:hypothetical protein n=1 Tax=Streptomyces sp. Ag109_G2-15 TaxID=1938850 RepID=UPI000BE30BD6|nr:hypothetical protein [Streptomyces sp. Ag109_G2-15]
MEVAALWPVVWHSNDEPFWRFVHNGWSVEKPGHFPDGLDPMCPSPDLPYEVRGYTVPDGIVGEDHWGGAPRWWTKAWCTDLDKARELADALVAHRPHTTERPAGGDCGELRAEVWEQVTTDRSKLPSRVHRADADPDRPTVPHLPFDTWPPGLPRAQARTRLIPRRAAAAALRAEGMERARPVDVARLVHRRPYPGRYRDDAIAGQVHAVRHHVPPCS